MTYDHINFLNIFPTQSCLNLGEGPTFCLGHKKIYNQAYNYVASSEEVVQDGRSDGVDQDWEGERQPEATDTPD